MRLNVNRVLHTPDASQNFHFEMDLHDLEFGGEKPVSQPVVVDGRIRNKAGMLLLELQASTTLRCRCSRCLDPFDLPKTTDYSCVLAEEKQFEDSDDIVLLDHDEVDPEDLARTAFILDMDTVFYALPTARVCAPAAVQTSTAKAAAAKSRWIPAWRRWPSSCRRKTHKLFYKFTAQAV